MTELIGPNVRLRPLMDEDLPVYQRIYGSPVLTRYLGVDRMTPEKAAAAFYTPTPRKLVFAITSHDDDTMVGMIGLLLEEYGSNAMCTGLVILPGSPVKGCGSEAGRLLFAHAFGPLGIHRVWAGHRADHTMMSGVMTGAGLEREATLRELFRTQGRWHDVTTYAAVAHRWREQASPLELAIMRGAVLSRS
ncbi:GNAT family N-acetyltransferase [Lentzea sp. NEAU-D7]|uniref:GNAT family N-acetyltransferase n=1 Tax=Lentzea sp. NEAU-D7 TaxID=2994667 RepID=UPI00224B6956|nr:GNAT family protein [Lentzea sp. NEAU-D7]MCX2948051.1 GNAT family protein [Lentzea sp. NEAU-D7]